MGGETYILVCHFSGGQMVARGNTDVLVEGGL